MSTAPSRLLTTTRITVPTDSSLPSHREPDLSHP